MLWPVTFAAFFGFVLGYQVGKGKGADYRRYIQARLDDAENLLQLIEGYVASAKARGNQSEMLQYADEKIETYKRRWIR